MRKHTYSHAPSIFAQMSIHSLYNINLVIVTASIVI